MIKINVLISNKNWKKYIKDPDLYFKKKTTKVQKKLSLFKKKKFSFSLLLAGNKEIQILNKKFRKKNKTTDVLSFPFYEKKILNKLLKKPQNIYLGDIIINLNKIIEQAKNKEFTSVFDKIWIHGLSHLLGYRHKSNNEFLVMKKIENKIYKCIN